MRGIVAGTFDIFHDGHWALLHTTFEYGDKVTIGITPTRDAQKGRSREVTPFEERRDKVEGVAKTLRNFHGCDFRIVKIVDPIMEAVDSTADYIVYSGEPKTHKNIREINRKRVEKGRDPLRLVRAPQVRDEGRRRISATRIAKGEINKHGEKQW